MPVDRSWVAAAVLMFLLLGACADQPLNPRGITSSSGPEQNRIPTATSVQWFGAQCNDGADDTQAFRRAVLEASVVTVPACDFHLSEQIRVPSHTTIRGEGRNSRLIVSDTSMKRVIYVNDPNLNDALVTDVVIEGLHVELKGPTTKSADLNRFAFGARFAQRVQFRNNTVTAMGGFHLDGVSDVEVVQNQLHGGSVSDSSYTGISVFAYNFGGLVIPTRSVTVRGNDVRNYLFGIQWFGGISDPHHVHFNGIHAVEAVVIDSNTVANVAGGIWGSNGKDITVTRNTVTQCADMCLDAEGSQNVRFVKNTAGYAGASVLGSYFFSTEILFDDNTVLQNGTPNGTMWESAETNPDLAWVRMFWTANKWGTSRLAVVLRNNRFTYQGATTRVGLLQKNQSHRTEIDNNTLTNTVIDMATENNGSLIVTNNRIQLQYDAQRPAIYVGGSNVVFEPWRGTIHVQRNTVRSWSVQSAAGVSVWQWRFPYALNSYVEDNAIHGFPTSIRYGSRDMPPTYHTFRVVGNIVDGAITRAGDPGIYDEVHSNIFEGSEPNGPCGAQVIC